MPKVLGGQGTTEDIDFAKAFKSGVYDSIVTLDKFYSDVADKARKNRIAKILEEAGKAGTGNRHIDNALRQLAEAKNELQVQTSLNAALSAGTLTMADYNKQVKIDADLKSLVAQRDADLIENTKQSREEAAKLTAIIAQLRPIYAGLYDQEIQARQIAANDNLREQNLILERQIELAGQAADIRAIELDQFREMRRLKSLGIDPNSSIGQSALGLAGDASRRQIGAERSSLLNDVIDSGTGLGTSAARATLASPTSETFLKQQRAAYAEIDALRQQDVLSETQAAQAKAQVNDEMNQRRLQNAEGFFGALTGLSSASNDNLAAIGKQAALTSALVSAYSAINKAWDSAPFPANLGAVATVTAQTFANVAAIEGFKQGGYTGGGSRDAVAGVVHGQEWVSNAETTARNRNTLAAMAAGASFDRGMGLKIEVIHDGSTGIQVRQMSDGKVRIIAQQVLADERDGIVTEAVATSARLAPNWVADANKKPRRRSG
jgi:ribosomal protein S20